MSKSTQETLRFPPVDGLSVRADVDGGAMSSDVGPLILRGVDRQIGLTERLAQAIDDQRHPSDVTPPLRDRIAQRTVQIGGGDEDGNDANARRRDPRFKLGVERRPLDEAMDRASGPTFSRLANAVSTKDIDRMAPAFVDPFIASDPEAIVIDLDHSEDPTHGQQAFSFYSHDDQNRCDLPLFLCEGLSGTFIAAALRPGKRPTGAENARIVKRVLPRRRAAWRDPARGWACRQPGTHGPRPHRGPNRCHLRPRRQPDSVAAGHPLSGHQPSTSGGAR
jgi:hypothetical protein